jgi:ring-1,2-phenylacetyl-CoA epoxidase subunit PaaE
MKKYRMRICGRKTITPLTPEITPSVNRLRKSPSGIQPGTSEVPVIFEHTGAATFDASLKCLARGGRLVTCGATTGGDVRLSLHAVFSDEAVDSELFKGLLNKAKVADFLRTLVAPAGISEAFICGPAPMMDAAEAALREYGVPVEHIHTERFGTPELASVAPSRAAVVDTDAGARVTIVVDGMQRTLQVPFDGPALLDAGLAVGAPLPYACKGGVCCTCRARVLEGEVRMDRNFTLEPQEIAQGFVLTCQAHPVSDRVVVSFDER